MSKDNEPAFPVENRNIFCLQGHEDCAKAVVASMSHGLTKREWFAGMALQGMLSDTNRGGSLPEVVEGAFDFADAMIEASKKLP